MGPNSYHGIKVFFRNLILHTQNEGYLLEPFAKGRGVNQGCPISPFCYNAVGELLAQEIRNNSRIKGIHIHKNDVSNVISQFADDTALFLMYSETVLQEAINTLTRIECNTGLKISYEKTNIYHIGSLKNNNAKIYTQKNLNWTDGDIEMLGIKIRNNDCQDNRQYNQIIDKMADVAMNWKDRNLTLIRKCLIINSLMSSLFMYYMVTMPAMFNGSVHKSKQHHLPISVGR